MHGRALALAIARGPTSTAGVRLSWSTSAHTSRRVRECTDYRPKRERNREEIAHEGAVCILPLDETATDFHEVAAARDGEGES
jgi:hypothetical protein